MLLVDVRKDIKFILRPVESRKKALILREAKFPPAE